MFKDFEPSLEDWDSSLGLEIEAEMGVAEELGEEIYAIATNSPQTFFPKCRIRPLAGGRHRLAKLQVTISILSMAASVCAATCATPECAPPEGWDNFVNNIGSDLAPLLALFGEKVTTQYMSESLSWMDSLLFSLAPLGIITAIVAAIRVAGKPTLRSLIGRAMESRGIVEADLMSSTSSDVCELWNGEGVVRVLGSPVLLQLIQLEPKGEVAGSSSERTDANPTQEDTASDNTAGICTFHEAIQRGFYKEEGKESTGNADIHAGDYSDIEHLRTRQNPPNLSLNVSIKPLNRHLLIVFVILGILLQGGVLAFAAIAQYKLQLRKNNLPAVGYGFPVFFCGTLGLAIGMFLCAHTVETSTDEVTWVPSGGPRTVIWLQQGGQTVGDQRFGSFARIARWSEDKPLDNNILTSCKSASNKPTPNSMMGRSILVTVAIVTTLIAFIVQFIGLRAMHSLVTVAQLGAILIMTALRSCAHIQRNTKNDIAKPDQVEGHELDWLAKELGECQRWEIITGPAENEALGSSPGILSDPAMRVMMIRARLAILSSDWNLEDRSKVKALRNAIESTINQVSSIMTLDDDLKQDTTFLWAVPVKAQFKDRSEHSSKINLSLTRARDGNGNWKAWTIDETELEAVLCLSVSSLTEANRGRAMEGLPKLAPVRLLGLDTVERRVDYKLWIQRETALTETEFKPGSARYFGWVAGSHSDPNISPTRYLCVDTKRELDLLCAQEIYAAFIFQLASRIVKVGGITAQRVTDVPSDNNANKWGQFYLNNSNLEALATTFNESGLGTIEEAYFSIIPAFDAGEKLPHPHKAYREARIESRGLANKELWGKAADIDRWLYNNFKKTDAPPYNIELTNANTGNRILRMTQKLVTEDVRGESDDKLRRMWNTAYSHYQEFTGASEDRDCSLLNLCMTCEKSKPDTGLDTICQLVFDTTLTPNIQKQQVKEIVAKFIQFAIDREMFDGAEIVARSLWASAITEWDETKQKGNYFLFKLLIDVRQRRGHFLVNDELNRYLSNPESLLLATKTSVHTGVSAGDLRYGLVPIDLLLIRKYRTPLQVAAEYGHKSLVQQMLNGNPNLDVNAAPANYAGRTALQAAAGSGHVEVVKLLMVAGADINAEPAEKSGRTALQAAAEGGHTGVVELLLAADADINAEPGEWNGRTALQAAAGGGHSAVVEIFLAANAGINAAPAKKHGRTALQAAAKGGHTGIVKLLLAADADVNAAPAEKHGRTALQAAAGGGYTAVVEILLAVNAGVNAAPAKRDGRTALQAAADGGHTGAVDLLLAASADINAEPGERNGRTALQAAAGGGHTAVVELFLAAGAVVNAEPATYDGRTALQAAADGGHTGIVELLLAADADINAEPGEWNGRTALQAAAGGGHSAVVELLLAANADVNAESAKHDGRTALQAAAGGGHTVVVELLLVANADVNAEPTQDGQTALQAAAEGGHTRTVKLLLAADADVNAEPAKHDGRTALQAAAEGGHTRTVELLLAANADVNAKPTKHGRTALQAAAGGGHTRTVKLLLAAGADVNAKPTQDGQTALQAAAEGGHTRTVKLLLAADADVNAEPAKHDGRTALQAAADRGHAGIVELLLDANADVNAKPTKYGRTVLQEAVDRGHTRIVELLLAANADVNVKPTKYERTVLQEAVDRGHAGIVKLLLAANADVNAEPVRYGRMALRAAAGSGHTGIVQLLLASNADVNAKPAERGRTALEAAADRGHTGIVELLLAANADVNAKPTKYGQTALQAAAKGGHTGIAELLLAANADVNAKPTKHGRTALQAAAWGGHTRLVELLLAAGADVNAKPTNYGQTALQAAAEGGHTRTVGLLLAANADVNARPPKYGRTALQAAAKGGHTGIVELLLAANADVNAEPAAESGRTALQAAAEDGHTGIVQLLLVTNADVNAEPAEVHGRTALQAAAGRGHTGIVELLLAADADATAKPAKYNGRTALQAAADRGHTGVVELLLAKRRFTKTILEQAVAGCSY